MSERDRHVLEHEQVPLDALAARAEPAATAPCRRASAGFGLDERVESISDASREHGVVTLTGIGGVGKTRFALEVAGRAVSDHDSRASST